MEGGSFGTYTMSSSEEPLFLRGGCGTDNCPLKELAVLVGPMREVCDWGAAEERLGEGPTSPGEQRAGGPKAKGSGRGNLLSSVCVWGEGRDGAWLPGVEGSFRARLTPRQLIWV